MSVYIPSVCVRFVGSEVAIDGEPLKLGRPRRHPSMISVRGEWPGGTWEYEAKRGTRVPGATLFFTQEGVEEKRKSLEPEWSPVAGERVVHSSDGERGVVERAYEHPNLGWGEVRFEKSGLCRVMFNDVYPEEL